MTSMPKRRREDKLSGRIFTFFYRMFFMFGVAAVISLVFLLVTLSRLTNFTPPDLPDQMFLTYTFKSDLAEMITKPSIMQPLLRPAATLHDVVSALDLAATGKADSGSLRTAITYALEMTQARRQVNQNEGQTSHS